MSRLARPMLYAGTGGIVLGLSRLHAQFIGHYYFHLSSRLPWEGIYALFLCLAAYSLGLPDASRRGQAVWTASAAVIAAALAISVVSLTLGSALLPRFVVAGSALLLVPWYTGCALLATVGRGRGEGRDRVLAVVALDEADMLRADLEGSPERPASIVGVFSPSEARTTPLGGRPLIDAARSRKATVIVLDRAAQADASIVDQAALLHESGAVRIRTLSLFYEQWLGKLPLVELERVSLMFDIGELHRVSYTRFRRVTDLIVGLGGLIALILILPMVALGNALGNRGPLFYSQTRVGKGGIEFRIHKLRSMRDGGPHTLWTEENDPRIGWFGRQLRRSHVDELPQVVNVLRGDLSIVGPRPEQPRYVQELADKIPFYQLRHLVRPGITGWAQVKFDYAASEGEALEKLQYEFYYLRHQGLGLDLRILGRTLRSVVRRTGR